MFMEASGEAVSDNKKEEKHKIFHKTIFSISRWISYNILFINGISYNSYYNFVIRS